MSHVVLLAVFPQTPEITLPVDLSAPGGSPAALGARHRAYGVRAAHYRLMGGALLAALADRSGDGWTPELAEAWSLAYNLIAETMMAGAFGA